MFESSKSSTGTNIVKKCPLPKPKGTCNECNKSVNILILRARDKLYYCLKCYKKFSSDYFLMLPTCDNCNCFLTEKNIRLSLVDIKLCRQCVTDKEYRRIACRNPYIYCEIL